MSKFLIITEKPSVASDIAKALGGFKKGKDYYENEKSLISWAVGHLFTLAVPASMKEQDKWDMKKLPIMPMEFELEPAEKMSGRVNVLRKLIKDKNVSEIINACDAGREGELIFRYITQYARTKKTIKRLWLQSMTPEAIRDAFARLRSDAEMQPLASAARSRNEADWLVGINATRAFTLRLSGGRGSSGTSIAPRRDCGTMKLRRRSSASATANKASSSWKKRSRLRKWLLNSTISLHCSAKPTVGSGSPRNARCKSRRRFTKGTRPLPIRARIRALCRKIICRQLDRHWERSTIHSREKS